MERELFSLVCCLLRLVSLFRESSLLNYCNHNGSPAHRHTPGTEEGKETRRCALFRLSVTGFVLCVCCVCVCTN